MRVIFLGRHGIKGPCYLRRVLAYCVEYVQFRTIAITLKYPKPLWHISSQNWPYEQFKRKVKEDYSLGSLFSLKKSHFILLLFTDLFGAVGQYPLAWLCPKDPEVPRSRPLPPSANKKPSYDRVYESNEITYEGNSG